MWNKAHLGPSRFAVERGTTLLALLDNVEVDPELADTGSVFLKRRSVMRRQKRAFEDSLTRLEITVLGATSQTDEESAIRLQEAELIARFVETRTADRAGGCARGYAERQGCRPSASPGRCGGDSGALEGECW